MLKKNYKILIAIVLVLSIFFNIKQCDSAINQNKINKQNIAALTDTLKVEKLKNGQLRYSRSSYIMSLKELEKVNAEFAKKIKSLELKKTSSAIDIGGTYTGGQLNGSGSVIGEKPSILIPVNCNLDSIIGKNRLLNTYKINWEFADNWSYIKGWSNLQLWGSYVDTTLTFSLIDTKHFLDQHKLDIDITLVKSKDSNDIERVYATSTNTNFKINHLNSVELNTYNEKKKRFGVGLHIGPGINYNPTTQRIQPGIQVGLGLHYNLFSF
jgi:hypothetical protein